MPTAKPTEPTTLEGKIAEASAPPPDVPETGREMEVARPRTVTAQLAAPATRAELAAALPSFPGGVDRFVRLVQTAVRMTPQLKECTSVSVIGCAMQAAQLGLEPSVLGQAWLIPRTNRDTNQLEATFQIGWKGYVVLAARSGVRVRAETVKALDEFDYSRGLTLELTHRPPKPIGSPRGESVAWYAVATDMATRDVIDFTVLTKADVEKRRLVGANRTGDLTPGWRGWYDEMALKTAVRAVCRFLPLTVEAQTAMASDGTVRHEIGGQPDDYVARYDADDAIDVEP